MRSIKVIGTPCTSARICTKNGFTNLRLKIEETGAEIDLEVWRFKKTFSFAKFQCGLALKLVDDDRALVLHGTTWAFWQAGLMEPFLSQLIWFGLFRISRYL